MKNFFKPLVLMISLSTLSFSNFVYSDEPEISAENLGALVTNAENEAVSDLDSLKKEARNQILLDALNKALKPFTSQNKIGTSVYLASGNRGSTPADIELLKAIHNQGMSLVEPSDAIFGNNAPICYGIDVAFTASNGLELIEYLVSLNPDYSMKCKYGRNGESNTLRKLVINYEKKNPSKERLAAFKLPLVYSLAGLFEVIDNGDAANIDSFLEADIDLSGTSEVEFKRWRRSNRFNVLHQLAQCESSDGNSCKAIADKLFVAFESQEVDVKTLLNQKFDDEFKDGSFWYTPADMVALGVFDITNASQNKSSGNFNLELASVLEMYVDNGARIGNTIMKGADAGLELCAEKEETDPCHEVLSDLYEKLSARYFSTKEEVEAEKAEAEAEKAAAEAAKQEACKAKPWTCSK